MSSALYIVYGDRAYDLTTILLNKLSPETGLKADAKVLIKPNLVVAKPWQSGATTNPEIARAVIDYFRGRGFHQLIIAEGAWIGCDTKRAFDACGYSDLSMKTGVDLLDTKHDVMVKKTFNGDVFEISKAAVEADLIVNLPVIKGHCQTRLTCALKNMKGVISDREKRRFHADGLHEPIARLNTFFPNVLTIADGIYGDIDFEEGGNPVKMDTMLASLDRVLLDAYAANLLGYKPEDIGYIPLAAKAGIGSMDLSDDRIIRLNQPTVTRTFTHSARISRLRAYIDERDACSACAGNLFRALHMLDESGRLPRLPEKIHVGQGFKSDNKGDGWIGIGRCACRDLTCAGCPPSAADIKAYLESL